MSFLEKSASELLLELTQEQEEQVSGGAYTETTEEKETEDSYYKKYEYSENTVEEGKETNPLYQPLLQMQPMLRMSMMPRIRI